MSLAFSFPEFLFPPDRRAPPVRGSRPVGGDLYFASLRLQDQHSIVCFAAQGDERKLRRWSFFSRFRSGFDVICSCFCPTSAHIKPLHPPRPCRAGCGGGLRRQKRRQNVTSCRLNYALVCVCVRCMRLMCAVIRVPDVERCHRAAKRADPQKHRRYPLPQKAEQRSAEHQQRNRRHQKPHRYLFHPSSRSICCGCCTACKSAENSRLSIPLS